MDSGNILRSGHHFLISETWTVKTSLFPTSKIDIRYMDSGNILRSGHQLLISGRWTKLSMFRTSKVYFLNMDSFHCPYTGHQPVHAPEVTQEWARVLGAIFYLHKGREGVSKNARKSASREKRKVY